MAEQAKVKTRIEADNPCRERDGNRRAEGKRAEDREGDEGSWN